MLSEEFDIGRDEEVSRSDEIYVKAVEASEVPKRLEVWEVPEVLPPTQTLSRHISFQLSTYLAVKELFRKTMNFPANQ